MAALALVGLMLTNALVPDPKVTVSYPSCLDSVSYFNVTTAIVPNSNITFRFISLGMKNTDNTVDPYVQCSSGDTGSTYTDAGATMFAFIQTKCDPITGPDFKQPFYLSFALRALDPMQAKNAFNTNLIMRFGFVKPNSNTISVIESRGPPIPRIMAQCPVEASDQTSMGSTGNRLIGSSVGSGLATASMSTNIQALDPITTGSAADRGQALNATSGTASVQGAIVATALGACVSVWRLSTNEGGFNWIDFR